MYRVAAPRQRCIAHERAVTYSAAAPSAQAALAKIREGLDELAAADPSLCSDDELAAVTLGVSDTASRVAAQETRFVGAVQRRDVYRQDACTSVAGWLRLHTNLGPGAAKRRQRRAALLDRMPALQEAFEEGNARTEHVDVVLHRATPARVEQLLDHDETLAELATRAEPRHLAVAVERIIDAIDADGSDEPPCADDDLRELHLQDGYATLENLSGSVTPLLGEILRQVRHAFDTPDPAELPESQRRTPTQRFHDALQNALLVALENAGHTVGGVKVHTGVFVDLFTLLGADELATLKPRFASGKGITPELARHLIATSNPMMRAIIGLGPWNPVSIGRVRSMPDWMKVASHLGHVHCRAPGCDLPAVLCDEDHLQPFCAGGVTSTRNGAPMCHPHNVIKHEDGWNVAFNTDTGEVTWTSLDGTRVINLPAPDI